MANVTVAVSPKAAPSMSSVQVPASGPAQLSTAPSLAQSINASQWGFTQAQADALLVCVMEMRQILINAGLAK